MATIIEALAGRAEQIASAPLPAPVRERVALQHLGIAAALRWSQGHDGEGEDGAHGGAGGPTSPDELGARVRAACAWELDDRLLGARIGASAVPVAWVRAEGHRTEELLRATAAADEVAGRIGLVLLLATPGAGPRLWVAAAAAALVEGLLSGLRGPALAHALALGLAAADAASTGGGDATAGAAAQARATVAGVQAAQRALRGERGELGLLDEGSALLEGLSPWPLRAALRAPLDRWISPLLAFPQSPVALPFQAAVQAVEEILARHLKAADKRLRADQVERVEVRLSLPGWVLHRAPGPKPATHRLEEALARLILDGSLAPGTPPTLTPQGREAAIAELAGRIEVRLDEDHGLDLVEHLRRAFDPLLRGVSAAALGRYADAWLQGEDDALEGLSPRARLRLSRHLLALGLRGAPGDLGEARLDELHLLLGAAVRLWTTRGGTWPERRATPIGAPGWSWLDTVRRTEARLPAGAAEAWHPGRADGDAGAAVASLRAPGG